MNVKRCGTFMCVTMVVSLSCGIKGLETVVPLEDSLRDGRGHELMMALSVPEGDEMQSFSCWNYPTSIVVGTVHYRVDVKWLESGCNVYLTNDTTRPVADIVVKLMPNEEIARVHEFGNISLGCSRSTEYLAGSLSVKYLDSTTNTLFVYKRNQEHSRKSYLISKNIAVGISADTNAVDFALAILNAGLPEDERITLAPE